MHTLRKATTRKYSFYTRLCYASRCSDMRLWCILDKEKANKQTRIQTKNKREKTCIGKNGNF